MIVKYTDNFLKQLKKSDVRIRKAFKQRLLVLFTLPRLELISNSTEDKNIWLGRADDFRTANWLEIVEYSEVVMQQTQQLLAQ